MFLPISIASVATSALCRTPCFRYVVAVSYLSFAKSARLTKVAPRKDSPEALDPQYYEVATSFFVRLFH